MNTYIRIFSRRSRFSDHWSSVTFVCLLCLLPDMTLSMSSSHCRISCSISFPPAQERGSMNITDTGALASTGLGAEHVRQRKYRRTENEQTEGG